MLQIRVAPRRSGAAFVPFGATLTLQSRSAGGMSTQNAPSNHNGKSWIERVGGAVSARVADAFAHPLAQIGIILFCALWWTLKLPTDILTAALSILAITLTQMVLNNQNEREIDAHRRDIAMHAKLDELIVAKKGARNDFVAVEEKEEEEIVQLKEEVKEAIADSAEADDPHERRQAEQAVKQATQELTRKITKRRPGPRSAPGKRVSAKS